MTVGYVVGVGEPPVFTSQTTTHTDIMMFVPAPTFNRLLE